MVIRLEQNYRCTKKILDAANEVIEHNTQRKGKTLWTENDEGSPVAGIPGGGRKRRGHVHCRYHYGECGKEAKFSDHAILYRMNAQSNSIEKALLRASVPYRVISGAASSTSARKSRM